MTALIYTTKGNVLESSLTYQHEWDNQPDYIKFVERYRDATGEIVKESAHVYIKKTASIGTEAEAGNF